VTPSLTRPAVQTEAGLFELDQFLQPYDIMHLQHQAIYRLYVRALTAEAKCRALFADQ